MSLRMMSRVHERALCKEVLMRRIVFFLSIGGVLHIVQQPKSLWDSKKPTCGYAAANYHGLQTRLVHLNAIRLSFGCQDESRLFE